VAYGETYQSSASWVDSGSGINIYIGEIEPEVSENLISVIDPGLPNQLGVELENYFPLVMQFLSRDFSGPDNPPMLYASYGKTGDGRFGNQGGTLPNQVFMHWYGDNLSTLLERDGYIDKVRWFFAHEAAHVFQTNNAQMIDPANIWIHEGMAEITAAIILASLDPLTQQYVDTRVQNARSICLEMLDSDGLREHLANGQVELNYTCGLMIFDQIDNLLSASHGENALFDLWNAYERHVVYGNPAGPESFLLILSQFDQDAVDAVELLIN
jgi:hypothetical protein